MTTGTKFTGIAGQSELVRHNPATGAIVSREPANSKQSCLSLVGKSATAFDTWSQLPVDRRADCLRSLADEIERAGDAFCASMTEEIGAPRVWVQHNVDFAAYNLRETSTYADQLRTPVQEIKSGATQSYVLREPIGVCLAITPWNAPLILSVRAIGAALLCGNTVMLKGNEVAPRTYRLLAEAIARSDLPDNTVNLFLCAEQDSEEIVDVLIASPVVRHVSFTGSTRVGRRVASLCAKHLKRPLLELGGQASMLVLEDADLDAAADAAISGGYMNQGQICISTERLIVATTIAEHFIEQLEQRRCDLVLGDPAKEDTDIGPLIDTASAERLSGLLSDAVSKGARLIGGGGMRDAYFEPTIIDRVEPEMRLFQEEVFGPILSITRVDNDEEAITIANDSSYGLAAAVFSNDIARARRVAGQLDTGICHINRSTVDDDPHAPFGGMKQSGYGRFGGRWAIDEFTNQRWLTEKHP